MVEEHIYRVNYQWNGREITTIHLSKRETIEFIAGIGSQKVLHIYERDHLAQAETVSDFLRAAQAFNPDQGITLRGRIETNGEVGPRHRDVSVDRCLQTEAAR